MVEFRLHYVTFKRAIKTFPATIVSETMQMKLVPFSPVPFSEEVDVGPICKKNPCISASCWPVLSQGQLGWAWRHLNRWANSRQPKRSTSPNQVWVFTALSPQRAYQNGRTASASAASVKYAPCRLNLKVDKDLKDVYKWCGLSADSREVPQWKDARMLSDQPPGRILFVCSSLTWWLLALNSCSIIQT